MSAAHGSTRLATLLALTLAKPALAQPVDANVPTDAVAPASADSPEGSSNPGAPLVATELTSLSGRQCLRALVRARVPFERLRWPASGVVTPVVVHGPIGGVTIRASGSREIHETMDCVLALALARWTRLLRARGVRELHHFSVHRSATHAEVARQPVQPRHSGGLAIDAAVFVLDDGTAYEVYRDFHGSLGAPVCGPSARVAAQPAARFLRSLFCDTARAGYFHVLLSPNFNEEHHNHFHLEVTRSVSWVFVR